MRSDGIGNKIILITVLCAALGLFLILRPRLFAADPEPKLIDRLPESDILGKFYLLELARETASMMYYHKIQFKDLLSSEFLLSQGKSYGLDIQRPGYFFSNEEGEWGTFLHVSDSSRIPPGIVRLKQFTPLRDTLILNRKVTYFEDQNMYLFYDKTYIFLYHGDRIKYRLGRAIYAKNGDIGASWLKFKSIRTFRNEKLVVFSNSRKLKKYGVDYTVFAHDTDSLSFKLKGYIKSSQDLQIRMKAPGLSLEETPAIDKMLNLHLDLTVFKQNKNHPLYKWIVQMGRKVSFPTEQFFEAWTGDFSFRQGGTQMIREEVIETVYDEEFNMTELKTVREVPVPGFAVLVSVNEKGKDLVSRLFAKGILTKQADKKYRFLFSPPLKLTVKPDHLSGYSSDKAPATTVSSSCEGLWNYKGTKVAFRIDSLTRNEVYGSMQFPVNRLLRKGSKFF